MSSEITVDTIISNALQTSSNQTALLDAWCNGAWITQGVPVAGPTDMNHMPSLTFGSADIRGGDMSTIADMVNGTEQLPELAFPREIVIPKFSRFGDGQSSVDPRNDDIVQIIDDLNKYAVTYGIDAIGGKLTALFSAYLTTYFPSVITGVPGTNEAGMTDVQSILAGKGYAMPVAAEDAIYQRGRNRIMNDGARTEAAAVNDWAARGFQLPPGALAMQIQMSRQNAQDAVAQAASDINTKQAELAMDMYKFAITQMIDYRQKALASATDYLRIFTTTVMQRFGAEAYGPILEARNRMYMTSVELYRAMASVRELKVRASDSARKDEIDLNRIITAAKVEILRANSQAAVGAASAVGHVAASALSAVNGMATVANITTQ